MRLETTGRLPQAPTDVAAVLHKARDRVRNKRNIDHAAVPAVATAPTASPLTASAVAPPPPPAATTATPTIVEDVTLAVMRHWRVVALVAAATMLLGWLLAAIQPKRYRAVSIGAITPDARLLEPAEMIRGVDTLERRVIVASITALANAPSTRDAAGATDDYAISAFVLPNTNLFRIEVEGSNPRQAASIANRLPDFLANQARAMYRVYGVTLVSAATAPKKAVLPRAERAAATGLVLGLLLGVAAAYILHRRRLA